MQNNEDSNILTKYLPNLQIELYCAHRGRCMKETWQINNERVNFNRFYFLLEGTCDIVIDQVNYHVKKGHLILIPANKEYSYCIKEGNSMIKMWTHFNTYIGDRSLFDLIECDYLIDVSKNKLVTELFERLINIDKDKDQFVRHIMQIAILTEILAYYLEHCTYKYIGGERQNKLNFACIFSYIESHMDEVVTVNKMALLMHLTPNYFIQIFTKTFGCSPMKMANQIKMNRIKYLLENTNTSITDIASQVGFEDISHFSKFFKKHIGLSPREYRMNINFNSSSELSN